MIRKTAIAVIEQFTMFRRGKERVKMGLSEEEYQRILEAKLKELEELGPITDEELTCILKSKKAERSWDEFVQAN